MHSLGKTHSFSGSFSGLTHNSILDKFSQHNSDLLSFFWDVSVQTINDNRAENYEGGGICRDIIVTEKGCTHSVISDTTSIKTSEKAREIKEVKLWGI